MSHPVGQFKTFVELLQYRAIHQSDDLAFRLLPDGDIISNAPTVNFKQLHDKAHVIAESLLKTCQPGDRALLIYPSGIDFIAAFFGCLYAGVIAVPAYPPKRNQKLERLQTLVEDCQAAIALTDAHSYEIAKPQFEAVEELQHLPWLRTDIDTPETDSKTPSKSLANAVEAISENTIAFLQYTSGSTGNPKGVMVSHGNLVSNSESIYVAFEHSEDTVMVGWVPLFHDLGLIGNVLQPVFAGIPCTLIPPAAFLQRPMRWLEAIHEYRANTSGGPNFSYDLCVQTVKEEDLKRFDLSCWNVAFSGAEPIRYESVKAFSDKFACTGFEDKSHFPCYGMAETTLLITCIDVHSGNYVNCFDAEQLLEDTAVIVDESVKDATPWINCGYPRLDHSIKIVTPSTKESCADNTVGEIWAQGGSVTLGYWQKPEVTKETFAAYTSDSNEGPFLRTGDLGFIHEGNLYVTGRIKDVLIIRGLNHYPQDVELTAFESHEALMPNGAAAFTIEEGGEEKLVLVLEVKRTFLRKLDVNDVVMAIQKDIALNHEIQAHAIVLIKPGRLSKTSSGKVQRQKNKLMYLNDEIDGIAKVVKSDAIPLDELPVLSAARYRESDLENKKELLASFLQTLSACFAKVPTDQVDLQTPFVSLGLDSLALTQMNAHINDQLAVNLSVEQLFIYETIEQLATYIIQQGEAASRDNQSIPVLSNTSNTYPLSYAQQRMWFLAQYENSSLYNISGLLQLTGDINLDALGRAFEELVERHESLRTRFVTKGEEVLQYVQPNAEIDWKLSFIDLAGRPEDEIHETVTQQLDMPFDLANQNLFRANLYKVSDGEYRLALSMHHIISDGWSVSVLMKELSLLYSGFSIGEDIELPELCVHYKDYGQWQRTNLEQKDEDGNNLLKTQASYWQDKLAGLEPLELPLDYTRPAQIDYEGGRVPVSLDTSLTERLKTFCKWHNVTPYMVLLAGYACLLRTYSGQDDIAIGSPIAGRRRKDIENTIGFFVNTLVLRNTIAGNEDFLTLLKSVKTSTIEAFSNQDIPFEKVVDVVQPDRNPSISPLFQVMFVLQDKLSSQVEISGLHTSDLESYSSKSKFDITLELVDKGDRLDGFLEYKTSLLEPETVNRMAKHLVVLIDSLLARSKAPIDSHQVLSDKEASLQLEQWNDTQCQFPEGECIHEFFEQQANNSPSHTALVFEDTSLTYAELNQKANQLAHYLRSEKGVRPDSLVGICLERSFDLVIAILGIVKAGGAYVPLDPDYPEARLAYMLGDSDLTTVITSKEVLTRTPVTDTQALCVDELSVISMLEGLPKDNLPKSDIGLTSRHLAYIIYTSGSTGNPKGVMVEHDGIVNRIDWMHKKYGATSEDVFLQKTPFSFDVSLWEFFWPLMAGSTLAIARPKGHMDPDYLLETINQLNVTKLHFVPSMLSAMLIASVGKSCQNVKQVFCSGEALSLQHVNDFPSVFTHSELHNLYGPTEASVDVSYWDCLGEEKRYASVPIGKPISNIQLHVLDEQCRLVPQGVVGELHIGGVGLARGYLNREELTAEKFIPSPFSTLPSERLYKTGDLVRWLPDGNLEYLGRIDHQVKLRGFRIELGEIENTILSLDAIKEAVVLVKELNNEQQLIAYIVINPDCSVGTDTVQQQVRERLGVSLPEYMVPAIFMAIDAVPVTPNGKVDRRALPEPSFSESVPFEAPRTQTEITLANIWMSLLNAVEVGRNSNFFNLGGHSLLAARLNLQLQEHFSVELPLRALFEYKTLADLGTVIDSERQSDVSEASRFASISDAPNQDYLPLSFAQQRLWVVDQMEEGSSQYNMPAAIRIAGTIDLQALNTALNNIIQRHQILRTVYKQNDGNPYQEVLSDYDFSIKVIKSVEGTDEAIEVLAKEEADIPFDLASDLMIRAKFIEFTSSGNASSKNTSAGGVLLITLHHIASDGWSTAILINELTELYNSQLGHQLNNKQQSSSESQLTALPCQYKDYAYWQQNNYSEGSLSNEIGYWTKTLRNLPALHSLPLDHQRPAEPSFEGAVYRLKVSSKIQKGINRLAKENNATAFMVLHAAFSAFIGRYSGQTDVVIGTPVANRVPATVEPLIGLFVNTIVLRSDLDDVTSFEELIAQSRDCLLSAHEASHVPFDMVVDAVKPDRSASYNPLFQIMLAMQNNEVGELSLSGAESCELVESVYKTKFDLTLNISEDEESFVFAWEYACDLFGASTISAMASNFETLLDAMVLEPQRDLNTLPLLAFHKQSDLLTQYSFVEDTIDPDFDLSNTCIHEIFEKQVEVVPSNVALVYQDTELTYEQLNQQANFLANFLLSTASPVKLRKGNLIGLCMDRSVDMVVSLLAIVKAGCAYVPVDPSYPKARIDHILSDSGVSVVLTQNHLLSAIDFSGQFVLAVDSTAMKDAVATAESENIPPQFIVSSGKELGGSDLSYVIYTSGSTGLPKGSLLMHGGLCNLARAQQQAFHVASHSKVLQFASIAFDAATSEIFMALCIGASVHIVPKSTTQSPEDLTRYVESRGITHITLPPALLPLLEKSRWSSVTDMVVAGEHCPLPVAREWSEGRRFYNAYGPSECTVCASIGLISPNDDVIHMGKPMAGVQLYVLDDSLQLVPEGVAGQLYVGGRGVGRGYLNRPELNDEKFIHNPYSSSNEKIYATGDLVRWLRDGNLEFLGRIDHQVKIRGFRVELGEIETLLLKQSVVNDCAVLPITDSQGNQQLVAYFVANDDNYRIEALREPLADKLPSYMVPAFFVPLESFPLTPNGKLDRKALPSPDISSTVTTAYVAPRNDLDKTLIAIWTDVLRTDDIGIDHNFFDIGGHSLLAIQVASRVKSQCKIDLKVADIFSSPVLSSLSDKIATYEKSSSSAVYAEIVPRTDSKEALPLSLEQQAYWFLYQLEEGSSTYNTPAALRLVGNLHVDALNRALKVIVERHESLRTQFDFMDGQPLQRVLPMEKINFGLEIVAEQDFRDRKNLTRQIEADADYVFDLENELPIRARLLVVNNQEYILTLVMHHTVADGWSIDVLVAEMECLYKAFIQENVNPLNSLPIQYGDYVLWQKDHLNSQSYQKQLSYWKDNLQGLASMLDLPTDYPRPPVQSYRGKEIRFTLPFELTQGLNRYAKGHNTSLFNTLLAGLNILLSRYGRTNDIAVGTAVANRSQPELETLIGCFANTLVIRSKFDGEQSFSDLTKQVTNQAFAAYENSDVPFDTVVETVNPERSLGVPPLFQVMFRLHNHAATQNVSLHELATENIDIEANSAKLDLNFSLFETNGCLEGAIEYATDLFSETTVKRIARHFQKILESAVSNSESPINALTILSEDEISQVTEWNNTRVEYSADECLHHLVEKTAARVPNKTAYVWGDQALTYEQLNHKANQLAHFLQSKGIGPEKTVGMSVHRSYWAGISVLATMKAGGTYVPLDVNYPRDRVLHMLDVAKPSIILTVSSVKDKLSDFDGEIICLDELGDELSHYPKENPTHIGANHSAYILFTSGSTGKPKGILVSHRSFRNMAVSQEKLQLHNEESRVLQFASLSFSISFWGAFMAWIPGGTLYAVTEDESLPGDELYDLLNRAQITHVTWPVSLLTTVPTEKMPLSLQTVISSAEPCTDAVVERWTKRGCRFMNLYGNSEVSLGSTMYEYHSVGQKLTIGKPLPNTKMYLLDENLNQVPVGVIAEIHTAGVGLATRYVDRPEETAQCFIDSPFEDDVFFADEPPKLYKTGDLGRYLANGEIEFIGRDDYQVSIRGFRVELTEIEYVLRDHPSIEEVVVVDRLNDNKVAALVCYYVEKTVDGDSNTNTNQQLSSDDLIRFVSEKLPSYMIPSLFVRLDEMPLTPNRKIDRLALPAASFEQAGSDEFISPEGDLQIALADIWCEVLELDTVSASTSFFALGGHSLLAVQLVARIKENLQLHISVKDIFTHNTIISLAEKLKGKPQSMLGALPAIAPRSESGWEKDHNYLPLSLEQAPYWFLYQLEGGSATYNVPLAMQLDGSLDRTALEKAFKLLIERHESLRTQFVTVDGKPSQHIVDDWAFTLPVIDLSELEANNTVHKQTKLDAGYIFDLAAEIPIRGKLYSIDDSSYLLTLVVHHTVIDGWSLDILVTELAHIYQLLVSKNSDSLDTLEKPAIQYADYAVWQQQHVLGRYYDQQVDYWKNKLSGVPPVLNLPTDYTRPPIQSYKGSEVAIEIPYALTEEMKLFAAQNETTLFNVLLSGLAIMLGRYGRTQDIPIGTAIANRSRTELETLIGCFANTLVLRCGVDPKENFQQLVQKVGETTLEAFDNADVPFDGVVEAIQPERNLSIPPIFQVMFRLHNQKMGETAIFPGVKQTLITPETDYAKLDLNFSLAESDRGISGAIEYATDLFSPDTIQRMIAHYCSILESAMALYKQPIEELVMLSPTEIKHVQTWNETDVSYPNDECMHHLFEQMVERFPNKLAYVCGDDQFTYTELNVRANRLAHFLMSRGVTAETRVAVSVERSTWAGLSCLGIFKAGGTYVPLDASYPKERLNHMLEVAKPKIILTVGSLVERYADADAEVICLDENWPEISNQPIHNPASIGADHSAYVLFTSGTTGMPKGILVGHHSFRNVVISQQSLGLHASDSRVLQFASLSFSIALWGTFMAWTSSGTLYTVTKEESLPGEPLYNVLNRHQITHVTWPVSLLSTIDIDRVPMSLQTVISSAEPCNDAVVKRWTQRGCRFMNLYGNSEVCLGSTMYEYHQVGQKLTIGKALPNTQMYLLDETLQQVPIGVIAEIYTGGVGLARGYIDNPIANAASFIPSPFSDDPKVRLYKTGDLGRYLPNGEIEFIGREDFQVSIRGFRVELVEVEDVIRDIPGISSVVVISREDNQGLARLVCFYVADDEDTTINRSVLRKKVGDKLPSYMVPSAFIRLDEMPLTPNRKIDRMALPDVDDSLETSTEDLIEPTTAFEKQLTKIWCEILERDSVGITQNFFELGGHSLLATQVISQIKTKLSVEVPLQALFKQPTIEALAKLIESTDLSYVDEPIEPLVVRNNVPLSFAQERLWFLDRYEENSNFYHMPSVLKIQGDLNIAAMEKSFATIVERHEALRTNFINISGSALQKISTVEESGWYFETTKLDGSIEANYRQADKIVEGQLQIPFNLETDALLRTSLIQCGDEDFILFINMHHIVSDGWSISVLVREMQSLYLAYSQGEDQAPLDTLDVQYADFSVWQRNYLQGQVLQKQSQYWIDNLADHHPLDLPLDGKRPDNQTFNGDRLHFSIDKITKSKLEAVSAQAGTTLFMTMLAAFNVLLYRHSGQTDICVGTPIANRVKTEIEPLIGFFANTLVLRSDLSDNIRFSQLLQQVKQTNLSAQEHQDIPFEKVVDMVLPARDPSRSPLFQVSFALQTLPAIPERLGGITLETLERENKTAKFDMSLEFLDVENGLEGYFEYNTDLFKRETIERYRDHLLTLVNSILLNEEATVDELTINPIGITATSPWQPFGSDHNAYSFLHILLQESLNTVNLDIDSQDIDCHYAVLDGCYQLSPAGTVGRLYIQLPKIEDNVAQADINIPVEHVSSRRGIVRLGEQGDIVFNTGFTAKVVGHGFWLLESEDRVSLINNQLAYPDRISQALIAHPTVNDCFVRILKHQSLGLQIVAYVSTSGNFNPQELNGWLQQSLGNKALQGQSLQGKTDQIPLPYAYVPVTHIPHLKQGGVDKRALSELFVQSQDVEKTWQNQLSDSLGVKESHLVVRSTPPTSSLLHLSDILPAMDDDNARTASDSANAMEAKDARVLNDASSSEPAISFGGDIIESTVAASVSVPTSTEGFISCDNLAQVIERAATTFANKSCNFYYTDGSTTDITYAELYHKAKRVQAGLIGLGLQPQHKVIFQFDRNEDFIVAFWACILSGFIPVPIGASRDYSKSNANTAKVAHAFSMMDRAIVLTSDVLIDGVRNIASLESTPGIEVSSITPLYQCNASDEKAGFSASPDDVTLIMLTSGSTGLPKGVQLSHRNIISRTKGSIQHNGFNSDQVALNWMALDHVGGIIYFHIRDTYLGAKQLQVDTDYVLADPLRWLDLIHEHRVNVTWAPNFAFSLIVDSAEAVRNKAYDMSCMTFMLNGAEAVVPKTTQAFIELLTPFGLPDDSVKPVYGMSEISSGITYPERMTLTYSGDDSVFVSVGKPIPGVNLRIVDEADNLLREGESGRLQISGLTVTQGYLGGDEINKDAFTDDGWFKTGDLAFLEQGALTITGREKDVIIINGANYYSHEIISVIEELDTINVSYTGACAVRREEHQGDQLAIFFNTDITDNSKLIELIDQIKKQVMTRIGVQASFILPLTKSQIPKTEIGKIQLTKLATSFNKGEFDAVVKRLDILHGNANTLPNWFYEPQWVASSVNTRALSGIRHPLRDSNALLVFADNEGLSDKINLPCIKVFEGEEFTQQSDSKFVINPSEAADYLLLIEALVKQGNCPTHVVNLWGYDSSSNTASAKETASVSSVFYMAQALQKVEEADLPTQWLYVSKNSQRVTDDDMVNPEKSLVIPLLHAFGKEHAGVHCQHLDLSGELDELHGQLVLRELTINSGDREIAYRDNKRFVSKLESSRFDLDSENAFTIKNDDTFVITGGLGGIGVELASYLLKTHNCKLLLLGRTPEFNLDESKEQTLVDLRKLGSVSYKEADICNVDELETIIDQAEREWRTKLTGIFHLAGLSDTTSIVEQDLQQFNDLLRPKVLGTRALYDVINKRTKGLFVNFASVNGYFPAGGMAAYAAANRYQASFVDSVQSNRNVHSFCINWSMWDNTGMGVRYSNLKGASQAMGFEAISPQQGIYSLMACLNKGLTNTLVGLNISKPNIYSDLVHIPAVLNKPALCIASEGCMDAEVKLASMNFSDGFGNKVEPQIICRDRLPLTPSGQLDTNTLFASISGESKPTQEKVAPRNEIEATLIEVATEIFEITQPIGVKDNFFDIGANSLMVVKFHHEIQERLGVQFELVELFNSTTVEKVANFLSQQKKPNEVAKQARSVADDRKAAMQRRRQRGRARPRRGRD